MSGLKKSASTTHFSDNNELRQRKPHKRYASTGHSAQTTTSTTSTTTNNNIQLRYGDTIQLLTSTTYHVMNSQGATTTETAQEQQAMHAIGAYRKTNFYQGDSLFAIPPVESKHFHPSFFTIQPCSTSNHAAQDTSLLNYGDPFVLVDQNNLTWSNRTSMRTGYVGPRRRGRRGEMYLTFGTNDKPWDERRSRQ
jgi:hypothetical protein